MDGTQHQRGIVTGSASHSYQVGSQNSNSSGQIPESCIYPMCYGPSCIVLLAYFCPVFLSSKHVIFMRLYLPSCIKIPFLLFLLLILLVYKAYESVLVSLTDIYWKPIMYHVGRWTPVQLHEVILTGDSEK